MDKKTPKNAFKKQIMQKRITSHSDTKRRRSTFSRGEIFCRAAVLAAHAVFQPQGARLRDIHFFVRLFSNWLEHALGEDSLDVRSMQVSRFLKQLCEEGAMREVRRGSVPRYLLTRAGVVEVLRAIVEEPLFRRPNVLLFVRYFLGNYRPIILEMLASGSGSLPSALRVEVEHLLDVDMLLKRQRQLADRECQKLALRARDSLTMGTLAAKRFKEGKSQDEIIKELEKKHPYELNSEKPLSELYASFPPSHTYWELTTGAVSRATELWTPMNALWETYLNALEKLERQKVEKQGRGM